MKATYPNYTKQQIGITNMTISERMAEIASDLSRIVNNSVMVKEENWCHFGRPEREYQISVFLYITRLEQFHGPDLEKLLRDANDLIEREMGPIMKRANEQETAK